MTQKIILAKPVLTLAAILAADLAGTFAVVCTAWLVASWENFVQDPLPSLIPAAALSSILAVLGLAVWLFIGLPVHIFWMDRGKTALWRYAVPAAISGGLTGLIYVPLFPLTGPVGALIGASNALIFWLIRRPDRDTPSSSGSHKDSAIVF